MVDVVLHRQGASGVAGIVRRLALRPLAVPGQRRWCVKGAEGWTVGVDVLRPHPVLRVQPVFADELAQLGQVASRPEAHHRLLRAVSAALLVDEVEEVVEAHGFGRARMTLRSPTGEPWMMPRTKAEPAPGKGSGPPPTKYRKSAKSGSGSSPLSAHHCSYSRIDS